LVKELFGVETELHHIVAWEDCRVLVVVVLNHEVVVEVPGDIEAEYFEFGVVIIINIRAELKDRVAVDFHVCRPRIERGHLHCIDGRVVESHDSDVVVAEPHVVFSCLIAFVLATSTQHNLRIGWCGGGIVVNRHPRIECHVTTEVERGFGHLLHDRVDVSFDELFWRQLHEPATKPEIQRVPSEEKHGVWRSERLVLARIILVNPDKRLESRIIEACVVQALI